MKYIYRSILTLLLGVIFNSVFAQIPTKQINCIFKKKTDFDLNCKPNMSFKLKYTFSPINATDTLVSFSSQDTTIVTVDSLGQVKTFKKGYSYITISLNSNPSVFTTVGVDIFTPVDSAIISIPDSAWKQGDTVVIKPKFYPVNCRLKSFGFNVNNYNLLTEILHNDSVYSFRLDSIALYSFSIDPYGSLDYMESNTINIKVDTIHVASIKPIKKTITIRNGETKHVDVSILPSYATNKNLEWHTSNPTVVSFVLNTVFTSDSDIGSSTEIYGEANGNAYITLTSLDNPLLKDTILISVIPKNVNISALYSLINIGYKISDSIAVLDPPQFDVEIIINEPLIKAQIIKETVFTDSLITQNYVDSVAMELRKAINSIRCKCTDHTVYGCLSPDALNYNPLAELSDGNCKFAKITNTYLEMVSYDTLIDDTLGTNAIEDCNFNFDLTVDSIKIDSIVQTTPSKFTAYWSFWQKDSNYTISSEYSFNTEGNIYLYLSIYCGGKFKSSSDEMKAITAGKLVNLKSTLTSSRFVTDKSQTLNVYPLPLSSIMNIGYKPNSESNVTFSIVSMQGETIKEIKYPCHNGNNLYQINTEGLTAGLYLLRSIENGKQTGLISLIKN